MGEHQAQAENEQLPNGLLPGAGHVMLALDTERWMKAEKRAVDLIACIQPNKLSEERRNAVADYVQCLIMKCFPCQVCTFGSVPLKTYLPDGDIDLTVLCQNQNLKDTWANLVKDILDSEEKNENAEFHVKEIQCIQAEVKIIKCLVENIVVDISFNQVGGLCTLCFLDEVDNLISQNHLFKHSIILIKAWCYYESRILGAHHGLISTYALETLVLYIFHVFNNAFLGPLEVLYRFLEFFSNFDWDNFCVSLWGPVPINCLPDVTAEPPRKDSGELLLSKLFLEACSSVYAVFPASQESNGQQFATKHFNVIDPLRVSNNLGRSVSKGNFFRIRSAFAFGAKRLARLLACPKDNLTSEVNQFFMNTWERHGSGHRPDAPVVDPSYLRLSAPDGPCEFWNSSNGSTRKKVKESSNTDRIEVQVTRTHGVSNQHGENSSRMLHMKSDLSSATRSHSLESQFNVNSLQVTDQIGRDAAPGQVVPNDKIQRDLTRLSADPSGNDTEERLPFARTHSSPELTDNCNDISSQVQGETRDASATHSRLDSSYRRKNLGSQNLVSHSNHMSVEDTVVISQQSIDAADSNIVSNSFALSEEFSNSTGAQLMHQEDQDIVNMMGSASLQGFSNQIHVPFNETSGRLPYSIPPSFLASMGYTQHSFPGFVPSNIPLMDPSFSHVQYPRSLVQPQYYFPGIGLNPSEGEQSNEFFCPMDSVEATSDSWKKQDTGSSCRYDLENGDLNTLQSDEKPAASLSGLKYVPPPLRVTASSSGKVQHNHLRSRTSSESSCNRSSVKTSNSNKGKMGKKIPTNLISNQERGKVISRHVANDSDDDQEWGSLLNLGTEITERHPGSESAPLRVSRHHMPDSDIAQTSGSDSTISFPPLLIDPGSRHRMDKNSGLMTFYPTGPPIPFLTMLPLYNVPPETRTSDASSPLAGISTNESSKEQKADILSSDFVSHWQSLQFGRVCQNPRPLVYPSPIMVPPVYVNGQPPYDNPGRPLSTNTNMFSQLMTNDGNHLVPVAPLQSISNRHPNIYQSYMDNMPRYRSGTGTYLPNHKVLGSRRGNNNHDRNDNFSDREVIWNANSRSRTARNHNRNQSHKFNSQRERYSYEEGRSDQRWNSYMPSYQSQSGSLCSNFGEDGPKNVAYNMNPNGVSNGPSVPPGMMMYPYHNAAYISNNGHLEFGSLGQVDIPDINDTRARTSDDSRLHGSSAHCSSPDQPSSPHHHSY